MINFDKNLRLKKKKIFIITGKKSFKSSNVRKYLNFNNCQLLYHFKTNSVPEYSELKKIILKVSCFKPDIMIGVGGGSVMDLAKISSSVKNKYFSNYPKKNIIFKRDCKLILIPTTAGSGSEATNFAVLYKGKVKFSLKSNFFLPDKIFCYSSSLKKLNKNNKLCSALDVFCQAVESIFSKQSNPRSLIFASNALKLFKNNIFYYLKNNEKSFKNMFLAANYAGKAINITKTNVPHALSYYLTSKFKIGHGYAVFLNLYGFLSFLYEKKEIDGNNFLKKRFSFLFHIFLLKEVNKFCIYKFMENFNKLIGVKLNYKMFKIDNFKEVKNIRKQVNFERLKNCPIPINDNDLEDIILYK